MAQVQPLATLIGLIALVSAGCAFRRPLLSPAETRERGGEGGLRALATSQTSFDIPIISEEDFDRLTRSREGRPATDVQRKEAARVAALANAAAALGVQGGVVRRTRVSAPVFFVARDPVLTADGRVESADFFVAAVPLSGDVKWAAFRSSLLSAPLAGDAAPRALEGCALLYSEGGAALPPGVVLNLESRRRPVNASQRTIELSLGSAAGPGYAENRFVCGEPVLAERAPGRAAPVEIDTLPEFPSALDLPDDAVVISESDFLRALSATEALVVSKGTKATAARFAAAASERTALGLQARFTERKTFETSLAIVVRQATRAGSLLGADEFYLVPMRLSGDAEWVGDRVRLGFDGEIPTFNFDLAPCGVVYTPFRRDPACAGEMCIDAPHPWMGERGGFAGGGLAGVGPTGGSLPPRPQPTVRLFGRFGSTLDLNAIACTQSLRPPEREARQCGRTDSGRRTAETCNGRDDDCNGQVDDGGVCDLLPMSCPTAPRACGSITCGEIPDGLGGIVPCGAPCP
jgi:hypothetical protein